MEGEVDSAGRPAFNWFQPFNAANPMSFEDAVRSSKLYDQRQGSGSDAICRFPPTVDDLNPLCSVPLRRGGPLSSSIVISDQYSCLLAEGMNSSPSNN